MGGAAIVPEKRPLPRQRRTLLAWDRNFAGGWDRIKAKYDERFYRMWRYYLLSSAASFRARRNQLWQIVLSPHASTQAYESIRA